MNVPKCARKCRFTSTISHNVNTPTNKAIDQIHATPIAMHGQYYTHTYSNAVMCNVEVSRTLDMDVECPSKLEQLSSRAGFVPSGVRERGQYTTS